MKFKFKKNRTRSPEMATNSNKTKSVYFNDGVRKIDYVIISSKKVLAENLNKAYMLSQFTSNLKTNGLQLEMEDGYAITDLVCHKVHAPQAVLDKYSKIFDIDCSFNNPHYKYEKKIYFKWLASDVTRPNPNSRLFNRAPETLSGIQPTDYTSAERSLIVNKIMLKTRFGNVDKAVGFEEMVSRNIILAAYPLHDTPYQWTNAGPLSDRQLLAKFWANPRYFYKEQPLNLVEKYYGPEVAFYFAWLGFYTKMLVPAAIFGIISFLIGIINFYSFELKYIQKEICESDHNLCPMCPNHNYCGFTKLSNSCNMSKLTNILDNPSTAIFAIVMSFWGVIYMSNWKRKQAMMRLRWNLTDISIERTLRSAFLKSNPLMKKSSITDEFELYIPKWKTVRKRIISYFIIFILLFSYVVAIMLVLLFRLKFLSWGKQSGNKAFVENLLIIESFSSAIVTFLIVVVFDTIRQKVALKLSEWENPPTQLEFDNMFTLKLVIISMANTFFPLMYLAYFKGHFYTYPGDASQWTLLESFKADVCKPSGCLVDISIQLLTIMVMKNAKRALAEILTPRIKVLVEKFKHRRNVFVFDANTTSQWEADFVLIGAPKNFLYGEYIQMIIQYGMVTFFVAALPIAPLLALLNNIFEIRTDAMKLVKTYRRVVPRKVNGIGSWNTALIVMTVFGAISNPIIIAVTSNLIPRYTYRVHHQNSLSGFVNSTLSQFRVSDYPSIARSEDRNITVCYYSGKRFPPDHKNQYELTTEFWHQLVVKLIFFIVLENICLLFSMLLRYVIPVIPRKVQLKLENEQKILREARLNV